MADFIAIDAKADIKGSKKGKLTPAQHAQLNAWSLADKTGILDFGGKCEAKETTITNITSNEASVYFKNGYIVICGRLVQVEQDAIVKIITPTSGKVDGKIIAEFNLSGVGEEEFKVYSSNTTSLTQQDLNEEETGVYQFELYSYTATPTTVSLIRNNTNYVPDIGGKLRQFEEGLTGEGKPLANYDITKGSIEDRLTNLGFKQGSVSLTSGSATTNKITRQGNYCILSLTVKDLELSYLNQEQEIGEVKKEFCSFSMVGVECFCELDVSTRYIANNEAGKTVKGYGQIKVTYDGKVKILFLGACFEGVESVSLRASSIEGIAVRSFGYRIA